MKILSILIFLLGLTFSTVAQDNGEQLYEAVKKNDKEKVEKLIEEGADINHIVQAGPWMKVSILITAVNNKNVDIATLILSNKADVNWKDGFNTSAILYAASTGSNEMVNLLLQYGADINDNDGKGNTVLTAAKESKNKKLVSFVNEKIEEKK